MGEKNIRHFKRGFFYKGAKKIPEDFNEQDVPWLGHQYTSSLQQDDLMTIEEYHIAII